MLLIVCQPVTLLEAPSLFIFYLWNKTLLFFTALLSQQICSFSDSGFSRQGVDCLVFKLPCCLMNRALRPDKKLNHELSHTLLSEKCPAFVCAKSPLRHTTEEEGGESWVLISVELLPRCPTGELFFFFFFSPSLLCFEEFELFDEL